MIAVFTNNIPLAKEMLGDFTRGAKMVLIKDMYSLDGCRFDAAICVGSWQNDKKLVEAYKIFELRSNYEPKNITLW